MARVQQAPEQLKGFGWACRRDMLEDGLALHIEIRREHANLLPIDKGPRLADRRQSLANFQGNIRAAAATCKLKAQAALGGRVALSVRAEVRQAAQRRDWRGSCY
jgi:hypothetical protein